MRARSRPASKSRLSLFSNTRDDLRTRLLLKSFLWCVVESFDEFHPALQQFVVRDSLTRPAFQYLVHAVTLLAAKPVIREVCVVNHLPDHSNLRVADVKLFSEGLKRAVIAAMSKPFFME